MRVESHTIGVPFPPRQISNIGNAKAGCLRLPSINSKRILTDSPCPKAGVVFGEPIDLSQADPSASPTTMAAETTDRLEAAIKELMREGA